MVSERSGKWPSVGNRSNALADLWSVLRLRVAVATVADVVAVFVFGEDVEELATSSVSGFDRSSGSGA